MKDQNVPMSQTECCPRYFYLPDVCIIHTHFLIILPLIHANLTILPLDSVYLHHLSLPFALHRQRKMHVFITKSAPKYQLSCEFPRIFNPTWRPGLPPVCKMHHLKQSNFPTQQHDGRGRIVFHFVAKILYKFLKVHPLRSIAIVCPHTVKEVKLKEIFALVGSISHNTKSSLQSQHSASGIWFSWKSCLLKKKLDVFLGLQLTTNPNRIIL